MNPPVVLNVNDSASNRYYVTRILRSAGWAVLEAETGADALAQARVARPDVVVLDIKLPDMSGLEVCRMMRSDPSLDRVLVIQTSATFVTSEGKARGLQSGADQYLTQPFEAIELIAMVKNLLRLREKETEAREKALALGEADRRKDEFLAMLAHELRNPLSAVMTANTLLEDMELPETAERLVSTIGRQTRHLGRLVDDLLDVSRITHGKIQLRKHPFNLAAFVRKFVDSDAAVAVGRRHRTSLHVTDEPVWIDGDPTRIEQVLTNLFGNAVKYSEQGGQIAIALELDRQGDRETAVLRVRDGGIGIAPENLGSIFDLFFQVDESLARTQSGLGIGLTMVKRIVELHGGRVRVSSSGLGSGAEFSVELPAVAPERVAPPADASASSARRLAILVVDDNVDSCELYGLALEQAGYVVTTAHDGERGLQLLGERPFDAALLDIGLPKLDGYEVARSFRQRFPERPTALVALTGYGRPEDRRRASEAGFDGHLVKPVDLAAVHAMIERSVTSRRTASSSPTDSGGGLSPTGSGGGSG